MPSNSRTAKNASDKFAFEIFKQKAIHYCAYQERSLSQVKKKLKDIGASAHTIAKIVCYLQENNYLSEDRFVESFVNGKFRNNKWGKIKITVHLRLYHIDEQLIRKYIDKINNEAYLDVLREHISKKEKEIKEQNTVLKKQKILQYCFSKGFETDLINMLLEKN